MDQFQAYVICTSPRSGSTLLCGLLRDTGKAGDPESHFHSPSLSQWLGYYDLRREEYATRSDALRDVFAAACAQGKGGTDIFGLRMQRHSFDYFVTQLRSLHPTLSDDKSRIQAMFGSVLFIHLTRQDTLAQAISYVRAQQSGLWHQAPDGTELERLSAPQAPRYDPQAIAEKVSEFTEMNDAWTAWFAAERIKPLQLSYEALSDDPQAVLLHILRTLGVDHDQIGETPVSVARLADDMSREWAARFRTDPPLADG